jgi:hypothetical protein
MTLKCDEDLKYIETITGAKPHFIFQQKEYYFVLTETDKKRRGNFFAIRQDEVNKVGEQLRRSYASSPSHPDNIYKKITGLQQFSVG